jgi:hypothetical protein
MNSNLTNNRTWGKHKNGNWEPTYTNKNSNQILFVEPNSPEANYCGPVNNPSYSMNDTSSCTCSSNQTQKSEKVTVSVDKQVTRFFCLNN